MKKFIKKNWITILLALISIVAVAWAMQERQAREESPIVITDTININSPIKERYTDPNGSQHVVVVAGNNSLTKKQLIEYGAKSIPTVDSSAKLMKIAANKIEELTQVTSRLRADSLKAQKIITAQNRTIIFYKDKYAEIAYHPPLNVNDTTDQGTFDLKYDADLKVVKYWKRNKILGLPIGARKSYLDISNSDPRFTIQGVKNYIAEQPEPSFGLRVQAVSNYSFSRRLLNVGPGLQFDFKRFSLVGTYYYDFDANSWRPSIGARYDLIRL